MPSFFSIELLHLLPCRCLTFFGVRRGYAIGKVPLLYFELKATAFVITHYFAQLRVFLRECKEPIFEAGVVCDDRSPLVSLVEVYLGCFMCFLNTCNHIFQNLLFFRSVRSTPVFAQKSLGLHRRYLRNFQRRDSYWAGYRLLISKLAKVHIPSVYTANHD